MTASSPLKGIKVLEFAGLAPGPFAGLLLAEAGASVLRVDRPQTPNSATDDILLPDILAAHKSSIIVNLKDPRGQALIQRLARHIDVLIDPFRPGVLEKLGLGPDALLAANPRLVYARISGFRRDGRYAAMAGHEINYLAVSGVLDMHRRDGQKPYPSWNLLTDFAGGGATLVHGVLLAIIARHSSGKGQVVEANMVDGTAYLATFPRMALKTPIGNRPRGQNVLDGGAPWYTTYETADRKYMCVGALEPQFFNLLLTGLGLQNQGWETKRRDAALWPQLQNLFARTFRTKTRAEWEAVFDSSDACCVPVLEFAELETQPGREGDQRPAVTLRMTPCLSPAEREGRGYDVEVLRPGHGGKELLAEWVGWTEGEQYNVCNGNKGEEALVLTKTRSKL